MRELARDAEFNEADHPRDEDGKFGSEKSTPLVATITGEEFAPREVAGKALRTAAQSYYEKNLRGREVHSSALGRTVTFGKSKKAFSTSANPDKLRLFAAIENIVANGRLENTTLPRDPAIEANTKAYHYLVAKVQGPERIHDVGLTIREDNNGLLYYNHVADYGEGRPRRGVPLSTTSKAGPGYAGDETARGMKLEPVRDEINLDVLQAQIGTSKSLYVYRPLLNGSILVEWAEAQGVPDVASPSDMHVTIAYSEVAVDWGRLVPDAEPLTVSEGDRQLEKFGDGSALALRFEDRRLYERWQAIRDIGASWDWPEYKPHLTLSNAGRDVDLQVIGFFNGPLEFGPEVFAEIDPECRAKAEDEFKEADHPRADNGQFGSGSKVHIVTTHNVESGETEFYHVGSDEDDAAEAHDLAEHGDGEADGDDSAEYHAPRLQGGKPGGTTDTVHIVHAADGSGGVDIHGVHASEGAARGQAVAASRSEWDENGPTREEAGLSDLEEVDLVQAWNEEHADDHDGVTVKVDEDGDPVLDDDGEFQFEQDGEDVDPGADIREAFDAVSEEMFPGDETAAYPGLEEANAHFTSEGRHESVFNIHTHKARGSDAALAADAALSTKRARSALDRFALDRASVRRVDEDGHLHVSRTPISKANVCPYYGSEIPDAEALGLDPKRIYLLYRHPDELEKGAASVDGKQLLLGHKPVSAEAHAPEMWIGSVSSPEFADPYLFAKLDIVARQGIDEIQSGRQEQLSCGYRYRADMTPGTAPDGTNYDGVMRDIVFNHVAVVPEGRAGPDVLVLDSKPTRLKDLYSMPTPPVSSRTAATAGAFTGGLASGILASFRPKLAADARLDILPLLKGITAKNVKTRTPGLAKALDTALKGKFAKDEEMDAAAIQDVVEQVGELVMQSAPDIAAEVAPESATTTDEDDAQLREMLKAKGYTDEEIEAILKKEVASAADAEAARAAAEAAESKKDETERAMDAKIASAVTEARKGMVTKTDAEANARQAADAAVAASRASIVEDAMRTGREVRAAEDDVRPVVGKLAQDHDTVEGVYRAALKVLAIDGADTLPAASLPAVFKAHAAAKDAALPKIPTFAADAASGKSFEERFPNSKRFLG